MITSSKFYKPVIAKLTDKEAMFAEHGNPDFDFLAPSGDHPLMTRRVALGGSAARSELPGMGPFQITYNFSHAIRKNRFPKKNSMSTGSKRAGTGYYGSPGFSFRLLYEFLCEIYNGGFPFVDTYFGQIFKTRAVYDELMSIYETIQNDISQEQVSMYMTLPLKKDGSPDMRYNASKKYMDFKVWQDPIVRQDCKLLAEAIREDIKICLSTGRLPLRGKENPVVSKRTREARERLAGMIHSDRLFFASGQLIDHLNIYVEVGDIAA